MLNPSYLTLSRHNVYYFRWLLPPQFRQRGKTAFVKLSLQTREPKEAVQQMNYIEVKSLLENYSADLLAEQKRLIDEDGPLPAPRIKRLKRNIAYVQDDEAYESSEDFIYTLSQSKIATALDGHSHSCRR